VRHERDDIRHAEKPRCAPLHRGTRVEETVSSGRGLFTKGRV
jgi:hypothetical protein